ncbi:MAG: threonine/serine dehydratase [Alphaproteobacteria bacterium]|nr:threonine/serine dehydratase [Alphaproteobacteria bacterium]
MSTADLPVFTDIIAAADRLAGHVVRTPLLESTRLNDQVGGRLLIKAECLQRTGSFKFRGAFNRMSLIPDGRRAAGVVAYSSGNHAQGVAAAARAFGVAATIVMPKDAPAIKVANTTADGGEVVFYDRYRDVREEIGARLAEERGATIVKPYDDPGIIAGQGTIGLEIAAQLATLETPADAVLVPCGGGGLVSGIALALNSALPGVPVYAVEPAAFDDTRRSLVAGSRLANDPAARSICDALLAPTPGEITFALNHQLLAGGLTASDEAARAAMAAAFDAFKIVVEPGGAVALAAALTGQLDIGGKTVVVVASGGNVDPAVFTGALAA